MEENQQIKDAGLKITTPRVKVLQILKQSSENHLSAEKIYKSLVDMGEDIGLATVYRVLSQFETAGLVNRHYFESGQSVFEIAQQEHHDHLVCTECGNVKEFVDDIIENRQLTIAQQAGFKMTAHALIIYGICQNCLPHAHLV